jgi:hypothetical protein
MDVAKFSKVLWDIDQNRIGDLPVTFIVRRVLTYGSVTLIFRAMQTYGKDVVSREFRLMKRQSMNWKRYAYLNEFVLS